MTVEEIAHYELYRSYVQHEDTLIDRRVNRSILAQTVIMAAIGYLLTNNEAFSSLSRALDLPPAHIITFVSLFGLAVAVAAWRGVHTSLHSIDNLTSQYKRTFLKAEIFPRLTYGGKQPNNWLYTIRIVTIPNISLAFWSITVVVIQLKHVTIDREVLRTVCVSQNVV